MLVQRKQVVGLLAGAMLALAACAPVAPVAGTALIVPAQAGSDDVPPHAKVIEFDISEDMTRFIFDQDVAYDDGMPADGSAFITRGYIYEPGTLTESDGVNADGSPQYPDKVIGEWICQGYMINEGAHATSGVWVFSTQFFQLGEEAGAQTIVTTGYELADVGVAIARAITGGTGDYATARGESSQTLLGLNASQGVNLRVQIAVEK